MIRPTVTVRKRLALAAAAVAAAVSAWPAPPAVSVAPDATAWWARTQLGPLVPIPSPRVPEGGLYVSAVAQETVAVSALRFDIPPDATVGDLVLEIESSQGTVALGACVVPVVWPAEQGGPYANAPAASCSQGSAPARVEGTTVRIPASGLVDQGRVNVLLLPAAGAVFDAVFKKPGTDALTVTEASPVTTTTETTVAETGSTSTGEDFDFGTDVVAEPFRPPADVGTVAAPPTTAAPAGGRVGPRRPVPPGPATVTPVQNIVRTNPRHRAIAILLATDLLLYYYLLRTNWFGKIRGDDAVPAADPSVRGIGRFARPREGTAPRL